MTAFGHWLDFVDWKMAVQRGEEEPPEGDGIDDMARSVILLEERWRELMQDYVGDSS